MYCTITLNSEKCGVKIIN